MLYRRAGIFHTDYAANRALFPIPADRWLIGLLLLLAATAPLYMNALYLSSYLLPWLVWTAATLGLNLILGWAGQFHLGYAAVMGIGAYAAVHAMRAGIPWEIAIILAGVTAAVIGIGFAFAALRVKGLYLALSTLALQFVMDWVISHVPAISGGTQATLQAPDIRLPLFFTKSTASQSSGLAFLKRVKARKEDRDTESGKAVTDPQAKALITWCATPDPEHAMLRAITQPALVVSGSRDTMLPADNAYTMFKALSNAQLLLYPDSGHGALFQHHEFFVSHVRTFLDADIGMTDGR